MVIDIHGRHVEPWIGQVMQVIVSILAVQHECIKRTELFAERRLHEQVTVPLAVFVLELSRLLPHRSARIAAFRVVEIDFGLPLSVPDLSEQSTLYPKRADIAVTPHFGRIVPVLLRITELIPSGRIHIFRIERAAQLVVDPMFPQHGRVDRTERPSFDRKTQVVIFDRIETWCPGSHVNRSRRGVILSRLEDGAFLPVVQRNGLHIVQREAPQVDLPVLGVAQLDAVVEHPDVLGSHAPDIDRLQSPDSAVVLDLDAGKITNGIGHGNHVQALEFCSRQFLCGNDLR